MFFFNNDQTCEAVRMELSIMVRVKGGVTDPAVSFAGYEEAPSHRLRKGKADIYPVHSATVPCL